MQVCSRIMGIPSKCGNKSINPFTNRLIQCQECKDHSLSIKVQNKRAATKRARAYRQAKYNLNKVINADLREEDAELKRVLDNLNSEKAEMEAKIRNKYIEYATLLRPSLIQYKLFPETTITTREVPDATPMPPPQMNEKPSSKEWVNWKIKMNSQKCQFLLIKNAKFITWQ